MTNKKPLEKQIVESNFFDLDGIIAKSEGVSCTFEEGELNPEFFPELLAIEKPTQIPEGFVADAPLWLIEAVKTARSIHLPESFCVNMQSVLTADAKNVSLARLDQNFYSHGQLLCQLLKENDPDAAFNLSKCLLTVMTQRLGGIVSNAANPSYKADKLDSWEAEVFQEAKKYKDDTEHWMRQESRSATSQKRKRPN